MSCIKSCKDCTERYVGCHSYCEKYKAEKARYDECKLREREQRDISYYIASSNYHRMNTRIRKSRSVVG